MYVKVNPWKLLGYETPEVIEPRPVYTTSVQESENAPAPSSYEAHNLSGVHIATVGRGHVALRTSSARALRIRVSDCSGRTLYHTTRGGSRSHTIDIGSRHGAGVYYVSVRSGERLFRQRVVLR
jgi:hypothetical protein